MPKCLFCPLWTNSYVWGIKILARKNNRGFRKPFFDLRSTAITPISESSMRNCIPFLSTQILRNKSCVPIECPIKYWQPFSRWSAFISNDCTVYKLTFISWTNEVQILRKSNWLTVFVVHSFIGRSMWDTKYKACLTRPNVMYVS